MSTGARRTGRHPPLAANTISAAASVYLLIWQTLGGGGGGACGPAALSDLQEPEQMVLLRMFHRLQTYTFPWREGKGGAGFVIFPANLSAQQRPTPPTFAGVCSVTVVTHGGGDLQRSASEGGRVT